MGFFDTKKIHFIGIGGHGVSALARLALRSGLSVSGSDLEETAITGELRQAGALVAIGHRLENLPAGTQMAVYTSAADPDTNPELIEAKKRGWLILSYTQALGLLSRERPAIAVSGTNGKTTTTLLLGQMLAAGNLDPLVICGGNVLGEHGGGFRLGQGQLVVEACEAFGNFLSLTPAHLLITNIEEDHLDYYKNIQEIAAAFEKLAGQTQKGGFLILNADDAETRKSKYLLSGANGLQVKTFGLEKPADFSVADIKTSAEAQEFSVNGEKFIIHVPGLFNIYNAVAACAMAMSLGVKPEAIRKVLADFHGSWRRFELMGEYRGAKIISDYGHHPSGIRMTIEAARQKYPGQRVIAVFHPHHKWRTRMLFKDFVDALAQADLAIVHEIWSVAGREPREDNVSSRDLVAELKKQGKQESFFASDFSEVKKILDEKIKSGDIILMMGAGYIYQLAEELAKLSF